MTDRTTHQQHERIFITGGTGFVGSALHARLGDRPLRLLVRDTGKYRSLESGNVELVAGSVTDAGSLRDAMTGCATVVHLVAIIEEDGSATFDQVIRQGTQNVVNEAREAGVRRFIHMSALGAGNLPDFPYHLAKWQSEQIVEQSGLDWTIFRPSVILGPGDGFISTLANLVRKAPVIPVVGSGESLFQPVFVDDVADAFVRAINDPSTVGKRYDLGGPDILTYEQLLDTIATALGKKKPKVHLPVGLMKLVVSASSPLPKSLRPPVTKEQLKMLALNNSTDHAATESLIGRRPLRLQDGLDYIK